MKCRITRVKTAAVVFALLLAACSQAAPPAPTPTKQAVSQAAPTVAAPAPSTATPAPSPATSPSAQVKPLSPPAKVRLGGVPTAGSIAIYIALEKGYFKDEGVDLEVTNFQTAGDIIPAVGQGQLDIAVGAVNAALFNAVGRGIALRIVADPAKVARSQGLLVRTDLANAVKDWPDLKGRKVAVPGRASSLEIILEAALKKGGLTLDDVNLNVMGFPDMLTAYANKSLDASMSTEPTSTQAVLQGIAVRWKGAEEIMPNRQDAAIVFSAQFAREKSEAGKRYIVAVARGARDFYQFLQTGKGKEEVIAAAMKYTPIKDRKVYDGLVWAGMDPELRVQAEKIQADLDWYVQKGYVTPPAPSLRDMIDNSFVDYAAQRLGKFTP